MVFEILYSPEALEHLAALSKSEQVLIVDQVEKQLAHLPQLVTRKRKTLRPNAIAQWELRLGDLRVFYDVLPEPIPQVAIKAVGKKVHNEIWIGGERIQL